MKRKNTPTPTNNEIILDPSKVIMSKTDYKGIIEYANKYFIDVCGYTYDELFDKPHNIIRHPDMPKIVFKIMWEKLHKGENLYAVVKNLTKDGSFYWVVTKFETTFDENGNIISHYARRKAVPQKIREQAESIYSLILQIEKHDEALAEKTFYETLEKYGLDYDSFFLEVADMTEKEVVEYFQSSDTNTNITYEDTILEIDAALEGKRKKLLDSLRNMERSNNTKIEEIPKKEIITNKGFLGNLSELNELKLALKKKNSLQ